MRILGINPGTRGGLAIIVISDGAAPQLIDAIDIPTVGTGAKERVDAIALASWITAHRPQHALIERAQAMPKQGASSGFKYGGAVGALEAAFACCAIPMTVVEPTAWKKFHRLRGGDKEGGRQRALQLFPNAHTLLARKKDHGRAEAALIALTGDLDMTISKILEGYVAQQQKLSQSNAFIDFAERQTPAPVKARQRAAKKPREKAKEKALQERDDLFRLWKQTMSLDEGPQLIELVRDGNWRCKDPDTGFEILSLINAAITALREQHGLPPFDDAQPDEDPTAFLIIREMFR